MTKDEKEKLYKYGKFVCDFAKAKTTDDILTSFFSNPESIFNFSSDFKAKALLQYPTKKMTIDSLSSMERTLLKMLLARKNILELCNRDLSVFNDLWDIEEYDPIDQRLIINEAKPSCSESTTAEGEKIYSLIKKNINSVPSQDIETYIDNLSFMGIAKEERKNATIKLVPAKDIKSVLKEKIKQLVKQCQIIEEFKQRATNRFTEVEIIARDYEKISKLHIHLTQTQKMVKSILLQMIESEKAYKSDAFKRMLDSYNYNFNRKRCIVANNRIVEFDTYNERFFLDYSDIYIFNVTIAYCLIEYFKESEYQGRERLTVCKRCSDIFIKSKLNSQQIYCSVCSKGNRKTAKENAEYMKGYRKEIKKRKEKEKKRRLEKEISKLISEGFNRKQAQELAALKLKEK